MNNTEMRRMSHEEFLWSLHGFFEIERPETLDKPRTEAIREMIARQVHQGKKSDASLWSRQPGKLNTDLYGSKE